MPILNAQWHRAHPMPKNPTDDERLAWHLAHVEKCGCRGIPAVVLKLMEARGIAEPDANFRDGGRRA